MIVKKFYFDAAHHAKQKFKSNVFVVVVFSICNWWLKYENNNNVIVLKVLVY